MTIQSFFAETMRTIFANYVVLYTIRASLSYSSRADLTMHMILQPLQDV